MLLLLTVICPSDGATKPTGLERTWPNVLGYEAVMGMEWSKATARDNPAQAAAQVRQSVQSMLDRARAEGRLTQAAERTKEGATKAAWITFGAMVLSLLAAVLGAMSGRRVAAVRVGRS